MGQRLSDDTVRSGMCNVDEIMTDNPLMVLGGPMEDTLTDALLSRPAPKIKVILEDRKVMALIDCGASMSVVSLAFVRGLGKSLADIDLWCGIGSHGFVVTGGRKEATAAIFGFRGPEYATIRGNRRKQCPIELRLTRGCQT